MTSNKVKSELKKEYLEKMIEMARKRIKDPFMEIFENKIIMSKEELIESQRELENDI